MRAMSIDNLFKSRLQVVNIGLKGFADDLESQGVPVQQVNWRPPGDGSPRVLALLASIAANPALKERMEQANGQTVQRMLAGNPVWVDVRPAGEVIPELKERMILHAGPPVNWERMCGPMRGAVTGIMVFEGWAKTLEEAGAQAAAGKVAFHPNHHFDAVGPMTGLTTRSQQVLVVENTTFGNKAYCTLNEGLGKVMRFGGNDPQVLERLRWLNGSLAPALSGALCHCGGIPLKPLVARGLAMGDEMHQRNAACTGLLLRELAPSLAATGTAGEALARILSFIAGNDQFFLNVAMALGKALTDPARGIEGSAIVTAMSRNGTDFGIRAGGLEGQWFTAPVEMPQGLYFPGFSAADANPDMGDSTIIETVGLGGFAMAAAPAVAGFVGAGSAADALRATRAMLQICHGQNPEWVIPALDFAGVPTGIDLLKVVETGVTPLINTGIAHKEPGVGQVGAGIVRAPMACFIQALEALLDALEKM